MTRRGVLKAEGAGSDTEAMPQLVRAGLLIVAISFLARSHDVSAEIYEWVDSEGHTQYTNELDRVPPSQRAAAAARASSRPEVIRVAPPEAGASRQEKSEEMECTPGGICYRKGAKIVFPGDRHEQGGPADPAERKINGMDEAGWRREAQQYRDKIALLEQRIEQMEAAGFDHAPDHRGRNMSRRNFDRYMDRNAAWQQAKSDLSMWRSNYERFKEKARRAGVPPGWLR